MPPSLCKTIRTARLLPAQIVHFQIHLLLILLAPCHPLTMFSIRSFLCGLGLRYDRFPDDMTIDLDT